jgi:glucokinase
MLKYLQIKFSAKARISIERVVSGRGISNIYEFLAWKFPKEVNKDVHQQWRTRTESSAPMNPAVITMAANDGTSGLCQKAVDTFIGAYGAEGGVVGLKYMPFGGLYLTGGVSCKLQKFISDPSQKHKRGHFMHAFLDKGRVSTMLHRIPVYLVKEEDMGERGVMLKAIRLYRARLNKTAG